VTGKVQLVHKTYDVFQVNIESMTIKPTGTVMINNKQNNQKIAAMLK
jgi:hypothetical protein